ncbi:MAG TPA: AMP-binding protein [Actinomycetota bacterium]|nr:AMP-binding protein [Actinomycetota bacterium]
MSPLDRLAALAALRGLARPSVLGRLLESGLVDARRLPATVRAAPWLLGRGASLGVLSRINAGALGDREALSDRLGTLSWRQLDDRAERVGRALVGLGGGTVATLLRNGREQVEVLLGAQKAGLAVAPLNTWARGEELRSALAQAAPATVVYDTQHAEQLREAGVAGVRLADVGDGGDALAASVAYGSLVEHHEPGLPPLGGPRGTPRIVIHTSGTTGKPKGAARRTGLGQAAPLVGLISVVPYRSDDVIVCPAPLFHSFGLLTATVAMLLGAKLVLPERFDPEGVLADVEHHGATAASLVPAMIHRIVELPDDVRGGYDVSSLRIVLASGSALGRGLRERARRTFGDVLYDLYGSTEAGWVAVATPEDMRRRPDAVGRPVPGVDVAVLSPAGDRLGPGETGELHVVTGATFEGYTSGEPPGRRPGHVSLGDLGRIDEEGYLFVEGRADDMVVVGGENVYPVEVEEAIQGLDGVDEVAVVGVDDEELGKVLSAFVVGRVDAEAVRDQCRKQLASFKVPRRVEVVDELPRTATGKVKKRELVGR